MLATLNGIISDKLKDIVVLDVNGVGYGTYVNIDDYSRLNLGEKYKLYIYEHIREQSHDLFGFLEIDTKALFEQLLGVNGVGPKMALSLLSIGNPNEVRQAIAEGNTKYIQAANGVGKRVAERVVIELKDKVGLVSSDLNDTEIFKSSLPHSNDEAAEALVSLGFSPADALKALDGVDTDLATEERIKLALKSKV
jgi:Holliday junction DNA helicase RuvA